MENFNPVYFDKKQEGIQKAVALQVSAEILKALIESGIIRSEKRAKKSLREIYAINKELLGD